MYEQNVNFSSWEAELKLVLNYTIKAAQDKTMSSE